MARIEDCALKIDFIENAFERYKGRDLNKVDSFKFLTMLYIKALVEPVRFNLVIVVGIAVAIALKAKLWGILMLVAMVAALPLIPVSITIRMSKAYRLGRTDAEQKKCYSNPYRLGTIFHDAYSDSYYKASK